MKNLRAAVILAATLIANSAAHGASAPSRLPALGVRALSDLRFPVAVTGDGPRTVAPGDREDGENASFEVSGPPNQAFVFLLPDEIPLFNRTRPGRPILIHDFRSNPPRGWPGLIGPSGRRTIYVGATRQPIGYGLPSGDYQGSFLIVTIY